MIKWGSSVCLILIFFFLLTNETIWLLFHCCDRVDLLTLERAVSIVKVIADARCNNRK